LRYVKSIVVFVLLSSLGGCGRSMTLVDDAMSEINGGGSCSVARLLRGQTACEEPTDTLTVDEANKKKTYCYRTLGVVDCYEDKDPFAKVEGRDANEKLVIGTPAVEPKRPVTKVPALRSATAKPMAHQPATKAPPAPLPANIVQPGSSATTDKMATPSVQMKQKAAVPKAVAPVPVMAPEAVPASPVVPISRKKPVKPKDPVMDDEPATAPPPALKPASRYDEKPVTPAIKS